MTLPKCCSTCRHCYAGGICLAACAVYIRQGQPCPKWEAKK